MTTWRDVSPERSTTGRFAAETNEPVSVASRQRQIRRVVFISRPSFSNGSHFRHRTVRSLLQKLRVGSTESCRHEGISHCAAAKEHFIPDTCAEVFAGGIGVMTVHAERLLAVLLLLPLPAHVQCMRLV